MSIFQFILTYDFDRPEKLVICDLIYVSNKYRLQPPQVEFGLPKELDQRPDIEDDPNSYIDAVVNPKYDHRMVPAETGFLYRRIPLAALRPADEHSIIPPAVPFTTYDILDQINAQFGVQLTEDDLENIEYTDMEDAFIIRAKPTSKIWTGWRNINVAGGGKKDLLFPQDRLFTFVHPNHIQADKRVQLTSIANNENTTQWREMIDFDFGAMENVVGEGGGRNTRVFIKAHREGYIDQWLYYTRLHPSTINDQFVDQPIPKVDIYETQFTVYQILAQINQALNLNLTAEDVYNDAFLPGLSEYPIRFRDTSRGWLPGVYMLQVNYVSDITNVRLVGDDSIRRPNDSDIRIYE